MEVRVQGRRPMQTCHAPPCHPAMPTTPAPLFHCPLHLVPMRTPPWRLLARTSCTPHPPPPIPLRGQYHVHPVALHLHTCRWPGTTCTLSSSIPSPAVSFLCAPRCPPPLHMQQESSVCTPLPSADLRHASPKMGEWVFSPVWAQWAECYTYCGQAMVLGAGFTCPWSSPASWWVSEAI